MAKDFLGNDINVGDEVVFVELGYRNLLRGQIIRISHKTCIISHKMTNTGRTESKQLHNQVVKIHRGLE